MERRIRITHCIGTMRLGGAEKQLAELITRLPRDKYDQTLVLLQGGGPLIERVKAAGVEVVELGYQMKYHWWNPRCYGVMGGALWRYIRHLRGFKPDILHAQLYWANILSVIAGRLAGVRAIITSRLQLSDYKLGRPMLQRIENAANIFTTAIFVNSEAVRKDSLTHERVQAEKLHLIYNGVVLEDFDGCNTGEVGLQSRPTREATRRGLGLGSDDIVIIAVANLHPYKGHDDLIRAFALLKPENANLRMILPGRDQGARSALQDLISELGLGGDIQLLGERSDIPSLLQASDIAVHPSHQEGFSNSILEAMTAGKPVVVTNVGGNPEAVHDGVNGFVVPARDPESLAGALRRLIDSAPLREQFGKASRARIESEFSMDVMIRNFDAWYSNLSK